MAQISEGLAGGEHGRAAIYSVALELFEGPLDLLLHLVRRHELDILDIPIAFVAEKYLEYLHLMRSLDLEVAGDYLVMAATLAWLKSRELLPAAPREGEVAGADDEEGEDPREALIRRLVEYERFKSAAAELDSLPMAGRDVFARGADIDVPPMDPGLAPVTLFKLAEAYYRVLTRAKINKTHDVTIEAVTVAQRMQQLTLMLDERQEFDFEALFLARSWSSEAELRGMLVVTLMSVLELVKLGVARVQQVPESDAIRVYRLVASEEARRILEDYDEDQSFGAPPPGDGPAPPSEAELDALEERALLAEALAGLDGPVDEDEAPGELGALAEEMDPEALTDQPELRPLADEADLGPDALAAAAANSAGAPVPGDRSEWAPAYSAGADEASYGATEAEPDEVSKLEADEASSEVTEAEADEALQPEAAEAPGEATNVEPDEASMPEVETDEAPSEATGAETADASKSGAAAEDTSRAEAEFEAALQAEAASRAEAEFEAALQAEAASRAEAEFEAELQAEAASRAEAEAAATANLDAAPDEATSAEPGPAAADVTSDSGPDAAAQPRADHGAPAQDTNDDPAPPADEEESP